MSIVLKLIWVTKKSFSFKGPKLLLWSIVKMNSIINLSIYNKHCSGGGSGGDDGDDVPQRYELFPLFSTISKR